MQGGRTTDTLSAPGTAQPPGMREEFQIRREVKHLEFYGSESGCNSFHFVSIVLFKVTAPRNGSAPRPSPCPEQLQGRQSARRKGCTRRKADLNYSFKVPITDNPVTLSQGKKKCVSGAGSASPSTARLQSSCPHHQQTAAVGPGTTISGHIPLVGASSALLQGHPIQLQGLTHTFIWPPILGPRH